jgi:hypothetical protein
LTHRTAPRFLACKATPWEKRSSPAAFASDGRRSGQNQKYLHGLGRRLWRAL